MMHSAGRCLLIGIAIAPKSAIGWSVSVSKGTRQTETRISPHNLCQPHHDDVFSSHNEIDRQSDSSKYGRGEMHLSAVLEEGDVVAYQTGTWLVDGVEVGDGSPPRVRYSLVETLQIVWTHNCEHGVIRGLLLERVNVSHFHLTEEQIEFGPEQLLARLVVEWDEREAQIIVPFEESGLLIT